MENLIIVLIVSSIWAVVRHLGPLGFFLVVIFDNSPLPLFNGPDILVVILAARRAEPWIFYPLAGTIGSIIGAYITYRIARAAGSDYLARKFGRHRVSTVMRYYTKWGATGLFLTAAVPIPMPTTWFFAGSGVLKYPLKRFLSVVGVARAIRYTFLSAIAFVYGRRVVKIVETPAQHLGWIVIACFLVAGVFVGFILFRKSRWMEIKLGGRQPEEYIERREVA